MDMRITGGADEYQAAAIAAVIQHLETEAATVRRPKNPNAQNAWLRAGRYQPLGRFQPPILPDAGLNWESD